MVAANHLCSFTKEFQLLHYIGGYIRVLGKGGEEDIVPDLRGCRAAPQRVVDPAEVVRRDPEVIIASWCGKKARLERIAARPGWEGISAVRAGRLHEIKSPDILAPGPSLLHGARQLAAILDGVTGAA